MTQSNRKIEELEGDPFAGGAIIAKGQPADEYFADSIVAQELRPVLSASLAHTFHHHSPARAWRDSQGGIAEYNKALVFGTVAHSVILRQDDWDADIEVMNPDYKDYRNPTARAWRNTMVAQGKFPVTQTEWESILAMRTEYENSGLANSLSAAGDAEVSIFWRCPETECLCKVRWDFLPERDWALKKGHPAFDYKTARSLIDWPAVNCRQYGLQLRAALYYESLIAAFGAPVNYAFLVQEKEHPFEMQCHWLALLAGHANQHHAEFIADGRAQLLEIKKRFRECQRSGKWQRRKELVEFSIPRGLGKKLRETPPAKISDKLSEGG